jgi:type I restriction enzyme S subunit
MSSAVPEGWVSTTIGEATSEISDGGTPTTSNAEYFNGSIPWVVIDDIQPRIVHTKSSITEVGLQKSSAKLWDKGTIILSTGATIGQVGIAMKAMATKQGICGVVVKSDVSAKYFYHLLVSKKRQLNTLSQGSTIKETRPPTVKKIEICLPPLPEQKKIASILTSVDEVIENTQKQIDKLQDLKKATMNELLTKGIGHTEFKESELGLIPKSWDERTIGESCNIKNTLRRPISREEREKIRGNYRYYGPTGILDYINEYRLEGEYTLIGEDGDHFIKFYDKPQSIYVTGKFNVNNHAHILEGNTVVSARWVYWFFLHRDIGAALTRQGAGRYKLNKDSLQKLKISIPPMTEQVEIDEKLKCFEALIRSKTEKLHQTQSLKKSLMQDLLTGKVRVTVN